MADSFFSRTVGPAVFAAILGACSTTAPNPVAADFRQSLGFGGVEVAFNDARSVPGVYDRAVRRLLDGDEAGLLDREDFDVYLGSRGGAGAEDEHLAERYLEYRIASELVSTLGANLRGEVPVDVLVNVERVLTPNAATMLLVGEIKGVHYDLDVVSADGADTVLLDLTEVSKPRVDRSSGGGGGLLGLAIRAGADTNVRDLEQMVAAVSGEVSGILASDTVNKSVADKIRRP